MAPLVAAALIAGGASFVKGAFGVAQSLIGRKAEKKLMANQVQYKRPEEYAQELTMRKQMMAQNEPSWMAQARGDVGGAVASGIGTLKETSMSSVGLNRGIGDLIQKQINAYQNLDMQAGQWKEQQRENFMGTLGKGAGYSQNELQWKQNQWDIAMNRGESRKQAGVSNIFEGFGDMAGRYMYYAGTKYYGDIMNTMMGGGKVGTTTGSSPNILEMYNEIQKAQKLNSSV